MITFQQYLDEKVSIVVGKRYMMDIYSGASNRKTPTEVKVVDYKKSVSGKAMVVFVGKDGKEKKIDAKLFQVRAKNLSESVDESRAQEVIQNVKNLINKTLEMTKGEGKHKKLRISKVRSDIYSLSYEMKPVASFTVKNNKVDSLKPGTDFNLLSSVKSELTS